MTVSAITGSSVTDLTDLIAQPAAPKIGPTVDTAAFERTLSAAAGASGSVSGDIHFRHQTSRSAELQPLQKFESFVLRSFIENMLPSENSSFFGTGTAGNIWRSMLAERIGDEMAASGGIGVADMIGKSRDIPKTGETKG